MQDALWRNNGKGGAAERERGHFRKKIIAVFLLIALLLMVSIAYGRAVFSRLASSTWQQFELATDRLVSVAPRGQKGDISPHGLDASSGIEEQNFTQQVKDFFTLVTSGSKVLSGMRTVSKLSFALDSEIGRLGRDAIGLSLNQRGGELVERLEKIRSDVVKLKGASGEVAASSEKLESGFPLERSSLFQFQVVLENLEKGLETAIAWLRSPRPRRILVLLQNSSELRPTGGFVGSVLEVTVSGGSIESVLFRDVNEIDRGSGVTVAPPRPLQGVITKWGVADANWFFNFPDSARKTIEFAEQSAAYRENKAAFDGVVAVSTNVARDLLRITGPIELSEFKLTLDERNVVEEIQRDVQLREEKNSAQPKRLIAAATAVVVEKLKGFDEQKKRLLKEQFEQWIGDRDVMVYAKDEALQRSFELYGMGGSVFELPGSFNGDYLAVVVSNVGGGKTDYAVKQSVLFQSQLQDGATASNHLVIERLHEGKSADARWYRVPNETYLRVFVPPSARISSFSGGYDKRITPRVNYRTAGYTSDALVAAIEGSAQELVGFPALSAFEEAGKRVFATWMKVAPGNASKAMFDYTHRLFLPPGPGVRYQFVFEKQPGAESEYSFEISAPAGFQWRENGLPLFEYKTSSPPARLVIGLTLEPTQGIPQE